MRAARELAATAPRGVARRRHRVPPWQTLVGAWPIDAGPAAGLRCTRRSARPSCTPPGPTPTRPTRRPSSGSSRACLTTPRSWRDVESWAVDEHRAARARRARAEARPADDARASPTSTRAPSSSTCPSSTPTTAARSTTRERGAGWPASTAARAGRPRRREAARHLARPAAAPRPPRVVHRRRTPRTARGDDAPSTPSRSVAATGQASDVVAVVDPPRRPAAGRRRRWRAPRSTLPDGPVARRVHRPRGVRRGRAAAGRRLLRRPARRPARARRDARDPAESSASGRRVPPGSTSTCVRGRAASTGR